MSKSRYLSSMDYGSLMLTDEVLLIKSRVMFLHEAGLDFLILPYPVQEILCKLFKILEFHISSCERNICFLDFWVDFAVVVLMRACICDIQLGHMKVF